MLQSVTFWIMTKLKSSIVLIAGLTVLTACSPTVQTPADSNSTSQTNNMSDGQALGDSNQSKIDKYDAAPEAATQAELEGKTATIKTNLGDIKIEFFAKEAPQTVTNFLFLAGEGFYDNLTFHRRVEGFVLQGGDPAGDGTGGPGYNVPAEINQHKHVRGAVATARLGDAANPTKASSGSQFYIVLEAAPYLDNEYTVFGQVVEGMDIVDQLQVGAVIESVTIN
jgi:peptidyl-prolyl cis-trans isomerase B (cyclophilin B)